LTDILLAVNCDKLAR